MIDAHKTDIQLAQSSLTLTQGSALKGYLSSTLAIDQKHLQGAQQAMRALKERASTALVRPAVRGGLYNAS